MLMRCPKCGKPMVCAACAGSTGGRARVAKGFASAEVQAKAQATRKRKALAAHDSHNPTGQGRADCGAYPGPGCSNSESKK